MTNNYLVLTDGENTLHVNYLAPYEGLMQLRASERMRWAERLQVAARCAAASVDLETWPCDSHVEHRPHLHEGAQWCKGITFDQEADDTDEGRHGLAKGQGSE